MRVRERARLARSASPARRAESSRTATLSARSTASSPSCRRSRSCPAASSASAPARKRTPGRRPAHTQIRTPRHSASFRVKPGRGVSGSRESGRRGGSRARAHARGGPGRSAIPGAAAGTAPSARQEAAARIGLRPTPGPLGPGPRLGRAPPAMDCRLPWQEGAMAGGHHGRRAHVAGKGTEKGERSGGERSGGEGEHSLKNGREKGRGKGEGVGEGHEVRGA